MRILFVHWSTVQAKDTVRITVGAPDNPVTYPNSIRRSKEMFISFETYIGNARGVPPKAEPMNLGGLLPL